MGLNWSAGSTLGYINVWPLAPAGRRSISAPHRIPAAAAFKRSQLRCLACILDLRATHSLAKLLESEGLSRTVIRYPSLSFQCPPKNRTHLKTQMSKALCVANCTPAASNLLVGCGKSPVLYAGPEPVWLRCGHAEERLLRKASKTSSTLFG